MPWNPLIYMCIWMCVHNLKETKAGIGLAHWLVVTVLCMIFMLFMDANYFI